MQQSIGLQGALISTGSHLLNRWHLLLMLWVWVLFSLLDDFSVHDLALNIGIDDGLPIILVHMVIIVRLYLLWYVFLFSGEIFRFFDLVCGHFLRSANTESLLHEVLFLKYVHFVFVIGYGQMLWLLAHPHFLNALLVQLYAHIWIGLLNPAPSLRLHDPFDSGTGLVSHGTMVGRRRWRTLQILMTVH